MLLRMGVLFIEDTENTGSDLVVDDGLVPTMSIPNS